MGHEDTFPPHRSNAGYAIGEETIAWARGNGRDAPIPDLAGLASIYVRGAAGLHGGEMGELLPLRKSC